MAIVSKVEEKSGSQPGFATTIWLAFIACSPGMVPRFALMHPHL